MKKYTYERKTTTNMKVIGFIDTDRMTMERYRAVDNVASCSVVLFFLLETDSYLYSGEVSY